MAVSSILLSFFKFEINSSFFISQVKTKRHHQNYWCYSSQFVVRHSCLSYSKSWSDIRALVTPKVDSMESELALWASPSFTRASSLSIYSKMKVPTLRWRSQESLGYVLPRLSCLRQVAEPITAHTKLNPKLELIMSYALWIMNTQNPSEILWLLRGSFERRRPPTLPHCIAVPSAQVGLTSLFGMGRGGTPPQ